MKIKLIIAYVILIGCLTARSNVFAQTALATPSLGDNVWGSSNTQINGINTAMIVIDTGDTPNTHGIKRVAALAYYGSGGDPGTVIVTDLNCGYTVTTNYPVSGGVTMASTPDVILGNNTSSGTPTADLIMAVAFMNNSGNYQVDFYDIHYTSPTVFTVTLNTSQVVTMISGSYTPIGTIHIDVVADHFHNVSPLYWGRPVCDNFFIVFDVDLHGGGGGGYDVHGAHGSLNSYSFGSTVDITNTVHPQDNIEPDVAGIQKQFGLTTHDIGRVTWVNQGRISTYEVDWDATSGATPGTTYARPAGVFFARPRIDADDNYATNGSAFNANFKIAVEADETGMIIPGQHEVYTYDNTAANVRTSALMSLATLPSPVFPAYDHWRPAIAFGSNSQNHYQITESMEESANPGSEFFMMEPIHKNNATNVALDPSAVRTYFLTNTGYPSNSGSGVTDYTNSVSTPCNAVDDISLVAWAFYDAGSGNYYVDYKTSFYAGSGTGYAYKKAQTSSVASVSTSQMTVTVFPNPAADHITINNPAIIATDSYTILDMNGKSLQKGKLLAGEQSVDIHDLANGTYIISLGKNGEEFGQRIFVKNN